ncbi:MAG: hypothetical protein UR98_C0017G0025 [Parcubacteria group bacterium GW2011_GWA1_36_12]|nr:MAG: hypothetical protein UR98_C0017G0025 [Parcubacteria group bacterium GW2011_GWA1_36_12]
MSPERVTSENEPTIEEIEASELYFSELEDALRHYSSCLPEGKHMTLTVRTNSEGKPNIELVTETRFPPLDDLPLHFQHLKFAAGNLDHISVSFWKDFYSKQLRGSRDIPYIPMQIVLWGTGNEGMRNFRREALMYEDLLSDFSWTDSNNPDSYRDHAEQCKRMLFSYLQLKDQIVQS